MSNVNQSAAAEREFHFTDEDFEFVRAELASHAGIILSDIKRDMVYNRLAKRLRALGLTRVDQYRELLHSDEGDEEFIHFVNALTTNLTAFFRENHHFDFLSKRALPEWQRSGKKRLRIWSAGCSVGEEPYSIAITLHEQLPAIASKDVKILATDIDTQVLAQASAGVYDRDRVKLLDKGRMKRWFLQGTGAKAHQVRVRPELRDMVSFLPLNLMDPRWPMKGPFDVIFCRNVMIYFDKETQHRLVERMTDLLAPGGYLIIGHSESVFGMGHRLDALGQTVYQRRS